jgi:vacuolar-type H+-ATPase subunit D/Vma8
LFVKKYGQVLSASKQVFAVTVSLLQLLSSLKEVHDRWIQASRSELAEAIENYKLQLAKYHKVLVNEGKSDRDEVTEVVMLEHKTKLDKYFLDKNIEGIT